MFFVYKHTVPDGKVYIGVTKNIKNRWRKTSYVENEYFSEAINLYGWNNIKHEVLFVTESKEDAGKKEQELILEYKSDNLDYGYNIEKGGFNGVQRSEYTKKKISQSLLGEKNPRFGKKFAYKARGGRNSNYDREKRSSSHKGQIPVNKIKVLQLNLENKVLNLYESFVEASVKTGVSISNISRVANGKRKTAGGFIWKIA